VEEAGERLGYSAPPSALRGLDDWDRKKKKSKSKR